MSDFDWNDENDDDTLKASFPVNGDGGCLHIRSTEPYGHYKVFTDKGVVPSTLKGSWTDLRMAKSAVQLYIARNVSDVKMRPKGEPAKIKTPKETRATATKAANKQKQEDSVDG